MATSKGFIEYIADQLQEAGNITYRKMFGEYGLYCNGKNFAFVCDDQLLLKVTEAGRRVCPNLPMGALYEGAKKKYFLVEDVDDRALLVSLTAATCGELPDPEHRPIRKRR